MSIANIYQLIWVRPQIIDIVKNRAELYKIKRK
jgi:hypothetical protein